MLQFIEQGGPFAYVLALLAFVAILLIWLVL